MSKCEHVPAAVAHAAPAKALSCLSVTHTQEFLQQELGCCEVTLGNILMVGNCKFFWVIHISLLH